MSKEPRSQPDRVPAVADGDVFAVPVTGFGFCALVVARAPRPKAETDFAFAYLRPTLDPTPAAADSIPPLDRWGHAWIGLVPTLPMRNGRWARTGALPGFQRDDWPVPPSRNSAVDESEPSETWAETPGGELWSVETTSDEPTMTVIDNVSASRDEALGFPHVEVVTAAGRLERAILNYIKNRTPGGGDMDFRPHDVDPGAVRHWLAHAMRARSRWVGDPAGWLPAGRATDRNLKAGLWLGFPLRGGGFGAAMLVEKPPKHLRFFADAVIMSMRRRWERWPTPDDLAPLTPDDGALISQTSMICVRDGRWRVISEHSRFDPEHWVWPHPWGQSVSQRGRGVVTVALSSTKYLEIAIDPEALRLDPHAGVRCQGCLPYSFIELEVCRLLNGTSPITDGKNGLYDSIVTPQRLAAWRTINSAIRQVIAAASP